MANLLVSFCNVFPRGLALGVYDFDGCHFKWIDLSSVVSGIAGVTGLTSHEGAYWCMIQMPDGQTSSLSKLDQRLGVSEAYHLAETGDAHSVLPFGDGLLANDTRRNRLTWIEIPVDGKPPREIEYWRYCDEDMDIVHVNSVAQLEGAVFVSMFGPKPEDGWQSARAGKIVDVTANRVVCDNLYHPHSLLNIDGMLYWLESGRGLVHRFSETNGHEVVAALPGYLRGIAYDGRHLYIGASARRRRSKSTGTTNKVGPLTVGEANSWIYRLNRETFEIDKRNLTAFGAEIYDIVPLVDGEDVNFDAEIDPIVQRMWRFEDEYLEAASRVESLVQLQADRQRILGQLGEKTRDLELLRKQMDELRCQHSRVLEELGRQSQLLAAAQAEREQLVKQLDTVWLHLQDLRGTRTVRLSRAVGNAINRVLRTS